MSAEHLFSWESDCSCFCCFQSSDCGFSGLFGKVVKQPDLFGFPFKRARCCDYWFWQHGKSVTVFIKNLILAVVCQLLKANKNGSAPIVAGVFLLRNCGLLAEGVFFCLSEDVPGEQSMTPSWNPVTLSRPCFGPEFRVVWLWERLASGWGCLWESSSIAPWFVPSVFRDVFGADPEWPWISGFRRNSPSRVRALKMRLSVLLRFLDSSFVSLPVSTNKSLRHVSETVLSWSENIGVLCEVPHNIILTIRLVQRRKFSFNYQSCHSIMEIIEQVQDWIIFYWRKAGH